MRSAHRARPERIVVRQIVSKRPGVVVQKSCVVILLQLLPDKLRTPQLRPFAVLLFVSGAVQLPKFPDPEASSPVVSVLLLPVSRLVVALGEKSLPRFCADGLGCSAKNRFPSCRRAVDRLTQESQRLLDSFCFMPYKSVRGSGFGACCARKDLKCCGLLHSTGLLFDRTEKLFTASYSNGSKGK